MPDLSSLHLLLRPGTVRATLRRTRLFFIVGMGRSGTRWLSDLFDLAEGCAAYHEAPGDRDALVRAYWSPRQARRYLRGRRERLIASRILRRGCHTYGEVNSLLRHHVDALWERWQPTILHLVRDGRAVVRSIINRTAFTPADRDHTGRLAPRPDDPWWERWPQMGRFERVCWYWASTNRYLMERHLPVVRFEDILHAYEALSSQILEPLGIALPVQIWQEHVRQPQNISRQRHFPPWEEWSSQQKRQFQEICGDVMQALGYEF